MKSRSYSNDSNKNLITEQPGFAILLAGIVTALLIGLLFRAVFSPNRMKEALNQTIASSQINANVQFRETHLSLANGWMPRLSVIISDVVIESQDECLLKPLVGINELQLPISLFSLLRGEVHFDKVKADYVNMRLQSEFKACRKMNREVQSEGGESPTPLSGGETERGADIKIPVPLIDSVQINELHVKYIPKENVEFTLAQISVDLKSESPRIVELNGLLLISREHFMTDYVAPAKLHLEIGDEKLISSVSGSWREGHYNFASDYNFKTDEINFTGDLKHLPISHILRAMKKYDLVKGEFNVQQIWLSLQMSLHDHFKNIATSAADMTHINLEGDLGNLKIDKIHVKSLDPFEVEPFQLGIQSLEIRKLLDFVGQDTPSSALGQLGTVTGELKYENVDHILFDGELKDFEFVFANKGFRQLQVVEKAKGHLVFSKKGFEASIDKVALQGGTYEGSLNLEHEYDRQIWDIKTNVQKLELSGKVQDLMTGGGRIGALRGEAHLNIQDQKLKEAKADLKSDFMMIEGVELSQVAVNIRNEGEQLHIQPKIDKVVFEEKSPVLNLLADLLSRNSLEAKNLEVKNFSGSLQTKNFATLDWKNLKAQSDTLRFESVGGWNEQAQLNGQILVKQKQNQQVWKIIGSRSDPMLEFIAKK